MGGQRNLIILGIAVFVGLIAVFAANHYFSSIDERQAQIAEAQKLARIVVATQPLEFGTPLTAQNVKLQNWPANSVPQGAFTSIPAALANNRVALRPIVPGEPVLADKVSGKDGRATLAANLPVGMRAVSIPITEVSGVSGFALPGTTVDVLLTRKIPGDGSDEQDQMVDVIMENVQILAINQLADSKDGKPKPGKTATLQTDLYGAQRLTLAQRIGTLSLVLRNVENQQPAALTTVTRRDLPNPGIFRPARRSAAPSAAMQMPVPQFYAAAPAPRTAPAAAPIISGPAMSVYRGTERSDYEVSRAGKW